MDKTSEKLMKMLRAKIEQLRIKSEREKGVVRLQTLAKAEGIGVCIGYLERIYQEVANESEN